ncbi:MAG: hypothetical protein KA713_09925 [Chryseotalea sp. WA131a]|nr:MAG: hypothetical protein KA713_09925 [Chryseotalea sp. WA131a]
MTTRLYYGIVVLVIASLTLFSFSPLQDSKGLGRVQKTLGKEVYVMCEPVREYEVVDRLTTSLTSSLAGRQTIQKQMQEVVDRALKRKDKGKIGDFDAVMTDDGDVIVIIKFKD